MPLRSNRKRSTINCPNQLQALYAQSGAKNLWEFVSAIVVSKNLGLDMQKVLDGLKTTSLG